MLTLCRALGLFLFLIVFSSQAWPTEAYSGKVIGVQDGDTLTVLDDLNRQHKIRLAEIDAPENNQAFGARAKQALSDLCFGKIVHVAVDEIDRYGREVAHVRVGAIDVNSQQIMHGYAWVYRAYSKNPRLLELEAKAKVARLGLWTDPKPEPPWEFRRGKKTPPTPLAETSAGCGSKRYCKEMQSCEEAYRYLNECGVTSLDGDGDGVPCEAICQ